MDYLMLVNKNNRLDFNYVPESLEVVENLKEDKPDMILLLNKKVHENFKEMVLAAEKAGLTIICDSAYRSYEYQRKLYENLLKSGKDISYLAPPGASEHQTGLCVDIAALQNGKYVDDPKMLEKEYIWLYNNSYKYGFILRYPKGKEEITGYPYEPWHYRYVGDVASTIMKNKITLEEYLKE